MSESEKKAREMSDVQQEYQSLCVKAGHLQYQIFALNKDLELVNEALKSLNLEAASMHAAAQKAEEKQS